MSAELLINVTPSETRVALVENGVLQEVHMERQGSLGLVGNVYIGKVSRVLPGMQAAFIDIGLDKAAFLHASDILVDEDVPPEVTPERNGSVPDIRELIRDGQFIMVQVVKDRIGTKGARLTPDVTIPYRYLVFLPRASHSGMTQRIED
ncbi:MAG: Rne/Rng family ribonuclease, partial [Psychrosphaera sp.]|nr:Rne/Rng family ribonuclease [Psychrosphaera sp.]